MPSFWAVEMLAQIKKRKPIINFVLFIFLLLMSNKIVPLYTKMHRRSTQRKLHFSEYLTPLNGLYTIKNAHLGSEPYCFDCLALSHIALVSWLEAEVMR
jgi:uncharacterized membrane protein